MAIPTEARRSPRRRDLDTGLIVFLVLRCRDMSPHLLDDVVEPYPAHATFILMQVKAGGMVKETISTDVRP